MTRDDINKYLAAMISAAATDPNGIPEGHMYAALATQNLGIHEYEMLIVLGLDKLWTRESGHILKLTAQGIGLAKEIDRATSAA